MRYGKSELRGAAADLGKRRRNEKTCQGGGSRTFACRIALVLYTAEARRSIGNGGFIKSYGKRRHGASVGYRRNIREHAADSADDGKHRRDGCRSRYGYCGARARTGPGTRTCAGARSRSRSRPDSDIYPRGAYVPSYHGRAVQSVCESVRPSEGFCRADGYPEFLRIHLPFRG